VNCQICSSPKSSILTKPLNVSCGDYFEGRRLFPADSDNASLMECADCGFAAFTPLLTWSEQTFQDRIYNQDYPLCDPPFEDARPRRLASWLRAQLHTETLLDYGGGRGTLAAMLRRTGIDARSYDPFHADDPLPAHTFDVVTAFEVIEHVPDQKDLLQTLKRYCKDDGLLVFSTLLKPKRLTADWWYASPRNGHVCFHTEDSLQRLAALCGLRVQSLSAEMHIAARDEEVLKRAQMWHAPQVNDAPTFALEGDWQTLIRS